MHNVVLVKKQDLYRDKKKDDCYKNVLAITDFNITFTFIETGWEKISHDSRILSEALTYPYAPFSFPPNKLMVFEVFLS